MLSYTAHAVVKWLASRCIHLKYKIANIRPKLHTKNPKSPTIEGLIKKNDDSIWYLSTFKGTGSPDGLCHGGHVWINEGLKEGRGCFLLFILFWGWGSTDFSL
jgi:hypothetical protein